MALHAPWPRAACAPVRPPPSGSYVLPPCYAGTRKEFDVDGTPVLVFWYRNQLFCIEGRSPAEGAYSEGFIKAKFTQVRPPTRAPREP